jgi:hypothetical protein
VSITTGSRGSRVNAQPGNRVGSVPKRQLRGRAADPDRRLVETPGVLRARRHAHAPVDRLDATPARALHELDERLDVDRRDLTLSAAGGDEAAEDLLLHRDRLRDAPAADEVELERRVGLVLRPPRAELLGLLRRRGGRLVREGTATSHDEAQRDPENGHRQRRDDSRPGLDGGRRRITPSFLDATSLAGPGGGVKRGRRRSHRKSSAGRPDGVPIGTPDIHVRA